MQRLLLCVLILTLCLAGCRQSEVANTSTAQLSLALDPATPTVGETVLIISLQDANGKPIDNAQLDIRGDMTHAGMLPVIRNSDTSSEGVYRVPFEWTMSGDWFVEISATLPDNTTFKQTFEYMVANP
jgi:nitrogen fixation protein FixH